ncbi:MAG: SBBP repeat-containing protein [Acidobacteriota bacterium]
MRRARWISLLLTAGALAHLAAAAPAIQSTSRSQALRAWSALPLAFEENRGQFPAPIQFAARGRFYSVLVEPAAIRVRMRAPSPSPSAPSPQLPHDIVFHLANAPAGWPKASGERPTPGAVHYLTGSHPVGAVQQFERLRLPQVRPGVDLVLFGNGESLEYDFEVAPGADPSAIALDVEGAGKLTLDPQGDLVLSTPGGLLHHKKPLVYQEGPRGVQPVKASFRLLSANRVGFDLGQYDPKRKLIIDPVLFSTFIGGTEDERAYGVAADSSGNIFVVGSTSSNNFPTSNGAYDQTYGGGGMDAFVVKLNSTGTQRIFSTYLGGNGADTALRVQTDSQGNPYVTGTTRSRDFPTTGGAPQRELKGGQDIFLCKLSAQGDRLLYSTFLGGTLDDTVSTILVDANGAALVGGTTNSNDLATTPDAYQKATRGGTEGWFAILNPQGTATAYLSYMGATGNDTLNSVALSSSGNLYFTGQTDSPNFPTTPDAWFPSITGGVDAYLVRLSADRSVIEYATLMGGKNTDTGTEIVVDRSETVLVAGTTSSTDFPTITPRLSPYRGGATDIWLTQFNFSAGPRTGNRLLTAPLVFRGVYPEPVSPVNDPPLPTGNPLPPVSGVRPPVYSQLLGSDGEDAVLRMSLGGSQMRMVTRFGGTQGVTPIPNGIGTCGGGQTNFGLVTFQYGADLQNPVQQCIAPGTPTDGLILDTQTIIFAGYVGGPVIDATGSGQGYLGKEDAVLISYSTVEPDPLIRESFLLTAGERASNHGIAGDPVNSASGELYDFELDIDLGGPMGLRLERHYGTLLKSSGISGALGPNWMHNYDSRISVRDARATVRVYPGRRIEFQRQGNEWILVNAEQFAYQLIAEPTSYRFYDALQQRILTFTPTGLVVKIEDLRGNALTLTQTPNGPEEISDGLGRSLRFIYDAGRLIRVEDTNGRAFTYEYTGEILRTVGLPGGGSITYTYTTAGPRSALLLFKTEAEGNTPYAQDYDNFARVIRQRDSRGNAMLLTYDAPSPGMTRVVDAAGGVSIQRHEGQNNLVEFTDAEGTRTQYDYNASNLPRTRQETGGTVFTSAYDTAGNLLRETTPTGEAVNYTYGEFKIAGFTVYKRTSSLFADGSGEVYRYDVNGNLTSWINRTGAVTAIAYDSHGWVSAVTRPTGGSVEFTFNPDGTRSQMREESGDLTRFEYDSTKRRTRIIWPDGTLRNYSYDVRDRIIGVTDERAKRHTLEYDRNGRLISWIDTSGQRRLYSYDANNRLLVHTEPGGKAWRYTYDPVGRLDSITDPAGVATRYRYDKAGRLTGISDGAGPLLTIVYDASGRVRTVANGNGQTMTYGRDTRGRVTSITEPSGAAWQFEYDAAGRLAAARNPLDERVQFAWRRGTLLEKETLADGAALALGYNSDSQLTSLTDPLQSAWKWERNSSGLISASVTPLNQRTIYTWGARRRLFSLRQSDGVTGNFAYDAAGDLTRIQYSDGADFEIQREERGLPIRGTNFVFTYDPAGRLASSNAINIGRDDAGRITSVAYTQDRVVRYTYNERGLVTRISDWLNGNTDFAYDSARRLLRINRPNGINTEYTYDAAGRLTRIAHLGGTGVNITLSLLRDAAGRLTSSTRTPAAAPTFAEATQDLAVNAARQLSLGRFDAAGRMTSDGGQRTFRWDGASRLREAVNGPSTVRFDYDSFGNIVSAGRQWVWNYATTLPSPAIERNGATDLVYHVFTPAGEWLYSIDSQGARLYGHTDESGNAVAVTNQLGAIAETYTITPYGESVTRSGGTTNPFTFRAAEGVIEFPSVGLYSMRARFFDGTTSRFLSPDWLILPTALRANPYNYASANPLAFTDATGLTPSVIAPQPVMPREQVASRLFESAQYQRANPAVLPGSDSIEAASLQPLVPLAVYPHPFLRGPRTQLPEDLSPARNRRWLANEAALTRELRRVVGLPPLALDLAAESSSISAPYGPPMPEDPEQAVWEAFSSFLPIIPR